MSSSPVSTKLKPAISPKPKSVPITQSYLVALTNSAKAVEGGKQVSESSRTPNPIPKSTATINDPKTTNPVKDKHSLVSTASTEPSVAAPSDLAKRPNNSPSPDQLEDGFQYPKKKKRNKKIITGTKDLDGQISGAPKPSRFLFIYRVSKTTITEDLSSYIRDQDVEVRSLERVSHRDAKFQSYKLETSKDDFKKLFNSDIWPSGICVRQYTPPRKDII